jgi:hypothetical protein
MSASAVRSRLPNEMGAMSDRRSVAMRTLFDAFFAASLVSDARAFSAFALRIL